MRKVMPSRLVGAISRIMVEHHKLLSSSMWPKVAQVAFQRQVSLPSCTLRGEVVVSPLANCHNDIDVSHSLTITRARCKPRLSSHIVAPIPGRGVPLTRKCVTLYTILLSRHPMQMRMLKTSIGENPSHRDLVPRRIAHSTRRLLIM